MGCCYGAPVVNRAAELERSGELEPLALGLPEAEDSKLPEDSVGAQISAPPVSQQASPSAPVTGSAGGGGGVSIDSLEATSASHAALHVSLHVPVARTGVTGTATPSRDAGIAAGVATGIARARPTLQTVSIDSIARPSQERAAAAVGVTAAPSARFAARNQAIARTHSLAPELIRLQYRELTPEDYDLLCLLDDNVPKQGTTPQNIVSRLPSVSACECPASECHICKTELQPRIQVSRLPCQHVFHTECISRWLTQCNGKCPLCLAPIEGVTDSEPYAFSGFGAMTPVKSTKLEGERPPAAACEPGCRRWPTGDRPAQTCKSNSITGVASEARP